jgi:hypothetical protein
VSTKPLGEEDEAAGGGDTPLPLVERLSIAGFVAPRLRSGAFPRKVKVVDESGVVTREITGEDLGKALLTRVDIECSSSPKPSTTCPMCGGKKALVSTFCQQCRKISRPPCPSCGGKKSRVSTHCVRCHRAAVARTFTCECCGGPKAKTHKTVRCGECQKKSFRANYLCGCGKPKKSAYSKRCQACFGRGLPKHACPGCGKEIAAKLAMCAPCAVNSRRKPCSRGCGRFARGAAMCGQCAARHRRATSTRCACGNPKKDSSKTCRSCAAKTSNRLRVDKTRLVCECGKSKDVRSKRCRTCSYRTGRKEVTDDRA